MIGRVQLGVAALAVLALALSACAQGQPTSAEVVQVRMFDDMRYDPPRFDFAAGHTVTFQVANEGDVRHEFYVGDIASHEQHAADIRQGAHESDVHDNPAAVAVEPGETGTLTYTFDEAGELLVGCHEPGHYEAGMVAPITVHP